MRGPGTRLPPSPDVRSGPGPRSGARSSSSAGPPKAAHSRGSSVSPRPSTPARAIHASRAVPGAHAARRSAAVLAQRDRRGHVRRHDTCSRPSRSAMVRATRSARWMPRAVMSLAVASCASVRCACRSSPQASSSRRAGEPTVRDTRTGERPIAGRGDARRDDGRGLARRLVQRAPRGETRGTETRMSMRSSSGPLTRADVAGRLLDAAAARPVLRAVPAAPAGVHRRDELEPRRVAHVPVGADDLDRAVLERLTERVEHAPVELGELVEEQHAQVRLRHQPGQQVAAATDHRGIAGRVVRRPEGSDMPLGGVRAHARHAADDGDLLRLPVVERRQQARDRSGRAASCRRPAGRAGAGRGRPRARPPAPTGPSAGRARRRGPRGGRLVGATPGRDGRRVRGDPEWRDAGSPWPRGARAGRPRGAPRRRGPPRPRPRRPPPGAPRRRSPPARRPGGGPPGRAWTPSAARPGPPATLPPSDSSPRSAHGPPLGRTCPDATRMPMAMATSYAAPRLRRSAGARLTVMRLSGYSKPEFRRAPRTRSRASDSAASGSPTMWHTGSPGATSTSTWTIDPWRPSMTAVTSVASMRASLATRPYRAITGSCRWASGGGGRRSLSRSRQAGAGWGRPRGAPSGRRRWPSRPRSATGRARTPAGRGGTARRC